MRWLTVAYSMTAAACLTLAAVHGAGPTSTSCQ